ncbi:MAG: hypothetical protein NC132_06785 [Corallococcus sp.]|nr:hypothetical protein [Corallococcus sp.]
MAFINVETLNGLFQWTTIIAILMAASALAYKTITVFRDGRTQKKARSKDDDYYPPQENDDYVTLHAEEVYAVNPYENVPSGKYGVTFVGETARISVNGVKHDCKNGDTILLADGDVVCSLYVDVVLKPIYDEQDESAVKSADSIAIADKNVTEE